MTITHPCEQQGAEQHDSGGRPNSQSHGLTVEWFKQRTDYYEQPGMLSAGERAEVLHMRAKAYCAKNETGGYVPETMLPRLTPVGWKQRAAALVAVGLWERTPAGYAITDWDEDQSELEALVMRRRADAARKRAQRERDRHAPEADTSRDESEDGSRDGHVTSEDSAAASERNTVKEEQNGSGFSSNYRQVTEPPADGTRHADSGASSSESAGHGPTEPQMSRDASRDRSRDSHGTVRTQEKEEEKEKKTSSSSTARKRAAAAEDAPPEPDPEIAARDKLARQVLAWWWDQLTTKPAGKQAWHASLRVVNNLLTVGHEAKDVAAAARAIGTPLTTARMEIELGRMRLAAASATTARPDDLGGDEHMARFLARQAARRSA